MEEWKEKKSKCSCGPFSPKRRQGTVSPTTETTMASVPSTPGNESGRQSTPSQSQRGKMRRQSRWYVLKRRMIRKGVVPVNKDHPRHCYLSCFREGLKQMNMQNPDVRPKDVLTVEDFQAVSTATITWKGKEFQFESFAMPVFATLRKAVGIAESNFMEALTPSNLPYLEFISNSKSGQDFFLSNDMAFMFKSNRKRDTLFFLSILKKYLQHFISYPHSLLVKYLGCYAIKMKGKRKKYILAMQSVFFPAERIEERFDVKGCTAGRYQKPNSPGSHIITILKDRNFFDQELHFGDESHWFVDQIIADSNFLKSLKCMDYSLLVGRQRKHPLDKKSSTVSVLIDRIGNLKQGDPYLVDNLCSGDSSIASPVKSSPNTAGNDTISHSIEESLDTERSEGVRPSLDTDRSESFQEPLDSDRRNSQNLNNNNVNHRLDHFLTSNSSLPRSDSSATYDIPGTLTEHPPSTVVMPKVTPGFMFPRSLVEGVDNFQIERRRLLPKCKNALHIIDGKEYRYYIGIVDFLTRFDWRQKSAQYWKMIKYGCGDHSTKHPDIYARRFVDFLTSRTR